MYIPPPALPLSVRALVPRTDRAKANALGKHNTCASLRNRGLSTPSRQHSNGSSGIVVVKLPILLSYSEGQGDLIEAAQSVAEPPKGRGATGVGVTVSGVHLLVWSNSDSLAAKMAGRWAAPACERGEAAATRGRDAFLRHESSCAHIALEKEHAVVQKDLGSNAMEATAQDDDNDDASSESSPSSSELSRSLLQPDDEDEGGEEGGETLEDRRRRRRRRRFSSAGVEGTIS